jgi:uncharacterized cupredoxin-like copper-binding protein
MRSRFLASVLAASTLLFGTAAAHAQSLILTPAAVPLAGHNGQSVTQELTLKNESDLPLDFNMEAQDVVVRDGARAFVEAGRLADSIAASAVFTPRSVHIAPRSSGSVSVTFTLPPAMRHRAVVAYFRGTTPVRSGSRSATLSLGTLFTFTVSDKISIAAGALEAEPPTSSANAQLRTRVVNDGTEPVIPTGVAVIVDADGRMVGKAAFNVKRLLPGEVAVLVADYPGELDAGSYRAVATFDVAGRPLTLTATLAVQ